MTDNASEEIAFCYLNDIKKKFVQNYDFDKIASLHAYSLTEFEEVLKQYMVISVSLNILNFKIIFL